MFDILCGLLVIVGVVLALLAFGPLAIALYDSNKKPKKVKTGDPIELRYGIDYFVE